MPAALNAESRDYIGLTVGFDISGKTNIFDDGNVWNSKSASLDTLMDILVYFNGENDGFRVGTGFSIGCGVPLLYSTSYGEVYGKKPFAFYGKVTGECAYFIDAKTAIESKAGFAVRVDQLNFRENYKEVQLSSPTMIFNASILGVAGLSARHEIVPGVVIRSGIEVDFSLLEYINAVQGPNIVYNYVGMYKGSRISVLPYMSALFSY